MDLRRKLGYEISSNEGILAGTGKSSDENREKARDEWVKKEGKRVKGDMGWVIGDLVSTAATYKSQMPRRPFPSFSLLLLLFLFAFNLAIILSTIEYCFRTLNPHLVHPLPLPFSSSCLPRKQPARPRRRQHPLRTPPTAVCFL